jgi:hypothetical protein
MSHTCSQNRSTLISIPPVAKPRTMHTGFTPAAYHEPNQLDPVTNQIQTTITQLIVWKVHVAHDCEHSYHDSLHSVEVAQLYPQVGDSITHQWLRVSILPNVHFLRCTARRSSQSLSQRFPACKTFTLRFHRCTSHILQMPPLVPSLGDKRTSSPKSRKSHPVLLPWISAKLGKQHATQLSLPISAMCFAR